MFKETIGEEYLFFHNSKDFAQPTVVEGLLQYHIPIDPAFLHFVSERTTDELASYWINKVAKEISASFYVRSQRKLPQQFSNSRIGGEETIFDYGLFLTTSIALNLINEEEAKDLKMLIEKGALSPLTVLGSNPRIFEVIDRLHDVCFYLRFIEVALSHSLILAEENDRVTKALLSEDIAKADSQTYLEIVSKILSMEPNEPNRYLKIRDRLERLPLRIGTRIVDGSHIRNITEVLETIYKEEKMIVAPSEIPNPGAFIKLTGIDVLRKLNEPSIVIEALNEIRSYTARPRPANIIKTHSLFPGEKAIITVETFRKENQSISQTTSVIDETSEDAERNLADEANFENSSSDERTRESSYSYGINAKATWGWGSAGGSYNASNTGKSVAKRTSKNISKALRRQVSKVSNNRSINIETSSTKNVEESNRYSIVRTIENINVSAPLNFWFRQLNQTSVSLTSMTDCRLIISWDLESLPIVTNLESFPDVFRKEFVKKTKGDIDKITSDLYGDVLKVLEGFGAAGVEDTSLIERSEYVDDPKIPRYQIKEELGGYYTPKDGLGFPEKLPFYGLLTNVDINTIKTEGVHVDCFIAQESNGLDHYSETLQEESGISQSLTNRHKNLLCTVVEEAIGLLRQEKDTEAKQKIFENILIPIVNSSGSDFEGE